MCTPRARWDPAWKALIEQIFHPWLTFFFPVVAAEVDSSQPPRFLDSELQRIAPRAVRRPSRVDRLVEVTFRGGRRGLLLIHIEVQSQQDPAFPLRMLHYHVALRLRYDLPVTSLALLADPVAGWKPSRAKLTAPSTRITFQFAVCKLLERLPGPSRAREPVLNHVVRAWRMALETAGQAQARFAGKIRLARSLIQAAGAAGCAPEEAAAVLRFLETAAALPARLEEVYETERNQLMEMVDLDVLTYSERKAFRKGRKEGLEAGLEQGRLETLRESAGRMRALGLELATIAQALGLSEDEAASFLTPPSSNPS